MMRFARSFCAAVALLASAASAFSQSALLQGGTWTPGHAPMYVGQGSTQPIVQDSGPASGGGLGLGLAEQLLTVRSSTNVYPAANAGTGQLGANWCNYDAPTTNSSGFHYLCLSPNAQGGGLIAYGAGGGASTLPLYLNVNGTAYQFPFTVGGIVGPGSSVVNDIACWNNTAGSLLKDCGPVISTSSNNTWTGTNNFTGPFQINSVAQTFPPSGNIVGTSDIQVLTNKSINAAQVNSGTLPGAQLPIMTGDVTTPGGSAVTTIAANAVTNAKLATATQNTVKGAATSTAVADLAVPSCSSAGNALQWTTNTGFNCATLTNQTAGFGLQLGGSAFSISQSAPPYGYDMPVNMGLTSSAGGSNLTINVVTAAGATPSSTNPVLIPFRSSTVATGTVTWDAVTSALSLVIPSGATLGTSNNVPFRLWIFAQNNGGTPVIGAATCSGTNGQLVYPCASWEYTSVTSTAITGLSTTAGLLYATSSVVGPARIIGYCDFASGLATAGSWASSCTTLQVFGPGIKKPGDEIQAFTTTGAGSTVGTGAYIATNATLSISVTASMNVIRIDSNAVCRLPSTTTVAVQVRRGVTAIGPPVGAINNSAGPASQPCSVNATDAPGTAGSVTYTVYFNGSAAGVIYPESSGSGAYLMTVREIMG